jgi:glycosyltransferase involved in cell wall biosynthesis
MKIGFITSPLTTGHAGRGVGFYTQNLLDHLDFAAQQKGHEIIRLKDVSQTSGLDLLHYPFFDLYFRTLPISSRIPFVVTVHDAIPLEFPDRYPSGIRGGLSLAIQKFALSHSRKIITDSYASVKAIHRYLHVPHEKIKLVYLAPAPYYRKVNDAKSLTTTVKKYHLPKTFILYVGDVNWNKNLYGLLAAAKNLNIPLVLVGKQSAVLDRADLDHPELSHLRPVLDLINRPDSQVYRLGFVSDADLVNIYNLASVYCQPSFAEGFGLPVLEAMACGIPVACSKTHSLPEIAGPAAVYFDPTNIDSITWSLKSLLDSKSEVIRLVRLGSIQVKKYSWDYTAKDTVRVYEEAISDE